MKSCCPNCGNSGNILPEHIGRKAKCPKCEHIFIIEEKKESQELIIEIESPKSEKQVETPPVSTPVQKTLDDISFVPNKISYLLLQQYVLFILVLAGLFGVVSIFFIGAIVGLIGCLLIALFVYIFTNISFKKEKYILKQNSIVHSFGSLFSDNGVEIQIDKITQISVKIGFIENLLFQTGSIFVHTAGSGTSKVVFRNIKNPMKMYDILQGYMRENGFSMQKQNLLISEKPHLLGVLGESTKGVVVNIFAMMYVLSGFLSDDKVSVEEYYTEDTMGGVVIFFGIILIIFLGKIILNYLDLKRRIYEVYEDVVYYSEGFLNKHYSLLPLEKITDIENNQSFLSKIFGIHDVVISSEGSSNQIYFYNMVNGLKMTQTLKHLKDNFQPIPKKTSQNSEKIENESESEMTDFSKNLKFNTEFIASFQPHIPKTIVKNIYMVFTVALIPAFIIQVVKAIRTYFTVGEKNIEFKYDLLTTKYNSFSVERITKVVLSESLLDKVFGTCSISFYSLGSSKPIVFYDIKKQENLEANILSKVGLYKTTQPIEIASVFGFLNYMKANIFVVGIVFLLSGSLFIIPQIFNEIQNTHFFGIGLLGVLGIHFIYSQIAYSKRFYQNKKYGEFFEKSFGILIQKKQYFNFDNIKAVEAQKYPFADCGTIQFDISGDVAVEQQGQKSITLSNNVSMKYIENAFVFVDDFENEQFQNMLDTTQEGIFKQSIGNSIVSLIGTFLVLVLFTYGAVILLFPVALIVMIWYVKTKRYVIEKQRILLYYGIVYKNKRSILIPKIDFVEKNQGFIHKIFGNGDIKIFTKGSSGKDMIFTDVPQHNELYEKIRAKIK